MRLQPQDEFSPASFKIRSRSSLLSTCWGRRGRRRYAAHFRLLRSRCHRSNVSGLGSKDRQDGRGSTRLTAGVDRLASSAVGQPDARAPAAGGVKPGLRREAWCQTGRGRPERRSRLGSSRRGGSTARSREYRTPLGPWPRAHSRAASSPDPSTQDRQYCPIRTDAGECSPTPDRTVEDLRPAALAARCRAAGRARARGVLIKRAARHPAAGPGDRQDVPDRRDFGARGRTQCLGYVDLRLTTLVCSVVEVQEGRHSVTPVSKEAQLPRLPDREDTAAGMIGQPSLSRLN